MSIHEECGVFGIIAREPVRAADISYYGLYALQHRGQESCGIVVNDDGVFEARKDLGLVSEVFSQEALSRFPEATMALMYATERQAETAAATVSPSKSIIRKDIWPSRITATFLTPPGLETSWSCQGPYFIPPAIRRP